MELVQKEGTRNEKSYNLDAIISVGYRVNSLRATQFRRWVTNVLKTFTIQGDVLDKYMLKILLKMAGNIRPHARCN